MLVETRLGRLFVEVHGAGTPLLLWHSFLCHGGMWRYQVPALAARYRVINIDGPGHGRSEAIRHPYSLEDCADAAVEIMDALSIERAHWAGLSWGGMTGMRIALRHPRRLRSLALCDTSAEHEDRKKLPKYRALSFIARVIAPGVPMLMDRVEPLFFTEKTRRAKPDLVRDFRDHAVRMDSESLGYSCDAIMFDRTDISDRLASIDVPTLVLVGSEDVATPPVRSRHIAARIPNAELVEIPGAAHLSVLEQPERINELLLRFFDRATAASDARDDRGGAP